MSYASHHLKSMYDGLKLNHPFVPRPAHGRCGRTSPQRLRSLCGSVHVRKEKRMSFVTTQPEARAAAAGALTAAVHEMFVTTLGTSSGSYAATEAANAIAVG
jgi:PE family